MKKLLLTALITGLLATSSVAFAATRAEIVAAAKAEVPAEAFMNSYEKDDTETEIRFRDPKTLLEYEIEVDNETGKVVEIKVTGSNIAGSTTVRKTPEDIQKIVMEEYPDAKDIVITLEKRGSNNQEYEAKFNTARFSKVELDINPVTGSIAKREMKVRQDLPAASAAAACETKSQQPQTCAQCNCKNAK